MTRQRYFLICIGLTLVASLELASSVGESFEIKDCSGNDKNANLKSVQISSCPDTSASSCTLKKGQDAAIDVNFETVNRFEQATVKIAGKLGPVKIPFSIKPNNACGNYGFNCPVDKGASEHLKLKLPVLQQYPTLSLVVELNLLNEAGKSIICIQFPAKIVKQ